MCIAYVNTVYWSTHMVISKQQYTSIFMPAGFVLRGHRAFGLSVHPSMDQVKIFVQGRTSRPINGSKLRMYLYDLMTNISRSANFRLWPIFHG